ncbi:MAG: leucine-rich repeat domain-containing protein [Bacteroidaceae bacterium]|jgi:hypothetical protein
MFIPNSVTSIAASFVNGCYRLKEISVASDNPVYASLDGALYTKGLDTLIRCPERKSSISFSNSIASIGKGAFYRCSYLESVVIGNSVTEIGDDAFSSCDAIKSIYCKGQVPARGDVGFTDDVLMYAILYVPVGTKAAYEAVDPWQNFRNIVEIEYEDEDATGIAAVPVSDGGISVYAPREVSF